jgi:hypothetical protein
MAEYLRSAQPNHGYRRRQARNIAVAILIGASLNELVRIVSSSHQKSFDPAETRAYRERMTLRSQRAREAH